MATWDELNRRILEAIKRGDTERADELLAAAWTEASTDQLRCNTFFTEGMLRDAQEQYGKAEDAFQHALDLDRKIHGSHHVAIADALHSIGLVRNKAGNLEGALDAFREASNIYRDGEEVHLAGSLRAIGNILMEQRHFEEARAAYRDAIAAKHARWLDRAEAYIGAGEACRRLATYPEALGMYAMATRPEQYPPSPAEADILARAWFATGKIARYSLRECQVMAAFAFWYATLLGDGAISAKAQLELATMPERALTTGDPTTWRFVYRNEEGDVHVSSFSHGLYYAKTPLVAELGDIVDVDIANHAAVAIRHVS